MGYVIFYVFIYLTDNFRFDLAFFDPSMFDSLRSIVYNDVEETGHSSAFYESLQLTFAVDISAEEGGGILELKPDGICWQLFNLLSN